MLNKRTIKEHLSQTSINKHDLKTAPTLQHAHNKKVNQTTSIKGRKCIQKETSSEENVDIFVTQPQLNEENADIFRQSKVK